MSCPTSFLYARAYAHATEDVEKVVRAVRSVVEARFTATTARGHHGNVIIIIEARLEDCEALEALKSIISRLDDVEFTLMLSGIEEGRLYVKFDKQQAFLGVLRVAHGDDVVYLEVRTRSLVVRDVREFLISLREALKT
ncbi:MULTISPECIES: RNA-binding domain-containing protein [Pyrobaculum]|uniref:Exosome protein n=2 Tax=Pyrobaculum arsenaticum TaxID=121277 RepID=A4WM61_PYRAR|nr:RNA-binding domain-containing protein [Pyrobaculum arsenaticum]ABP51478.1 Protein of unknown function DUF54 [Pyrobaculum arsenaticum DSM 13514]MCY0890955.1 exosome protein [Pyrobaculum arsenaticum]NYR16553.1 exosome protein [Pyrobaculum arsenaticum]